MNGLLLLLVAILFATSAVALPRVSMNERAANLVSDNGGCTLAWIPPDAGEHPGTNDIACYNKWCNQPDPGEDDCQITTYMKPGGEGWIKRCQCIPAGGAGQEVKCETRLDYTDLGGGAFSYTLVCIRQNCVATCDYMEAGDWELCVPC